MDALTYVELFAGAGGLSRGLEAAGFHAVAHAEIDLQARAVLRHHWPNTRLDGDVTKIDGKDYQGVTLISGGSPCQNLSLAGKRAGLKGEQSKLFHDQVRIWKESGAPYLLWENVYGALSSNKGEDFATVLSTIVGSPITQPTKQWRRGGVAAGSDAVAAWRVFDLQHFGPPQRRLRVFIVAARAGGVDPAELLALSESMCRHPAPRDQQKKTNALGTRGGAARSLGYTITNSSNRAGWFTGDIVGTIFAGGHKGTAFQHGILEQNIPDNTIAFESIGGTWGVNAGDTSPPIKVGSGLGIASPPAVLQSSASNIIIASATQSKAYFDKDVAFTLNTMHEQQYIKDRTGRPRRLTPLECERLMSWPDFWTKYGINEKGQVYELSDTARYRLCGNGVGSVCVQWIAERLAAAIHQQ